MTNKCLKKKNISRFVWLVNALILTFLRTVNDLKEFTLLTDMKLKLLKDKSWVQILLDFNAHERFISQNFLLKNDLVLDKQMKTFIQFVNDQRTQCYKIAKVLVIVKNFAN